MLALHDAVDLGDVDTLVKTSVYVGQVLVDLQDHDVRIPQDPFGNSCRAGEVEVAVPVHRSGAHHRDVDIQEVAVIGHHISEDHRDIIAQASVAELSLVSGAVPAVVYKVFPQGVAFRNLDRAKSQIAADFDIGQLIAAGGQRLVEKSRETDIGAVVNSVAALYIADGLFRSLQFAAVFVVIIYMGLRSFSYRVHINWTGLLFLGQ